MNTLVHADGDFSLAFESGEFTALNLGVTAVLPASLRVLLPRVMEALGGSIAPADRRELLSQWVKYDFDDDAWFILLNYMSVLVHELRHFHEYLGSPWGQAMLFYWMSLAGMNRGVMACLRDEGALVLPLTRWWELSDKDYDLARSALNPAMLKRTPPIAPWTREFAAKVLLQQSSLNRPLLKGDQFDLTILQLLEGTAFATQLHYLCDIYQDGSSLGWYVEMLKSKDPKRKYTQLLNHWYTLELHRNLQGAGDLRTPPISYALRNAVAFYSLCATAKGDRAALNANVAGGSKVHPGGVHVMLWDELRKSKTLPVVSGIVPWLDATARRLGLMTLKESLKASVRLGGSRVDRLTKLNSESGPANWAPEILEAYHQWTVAHEYMVNRILENPEAFFDPRLYVRNLNRWVAPAGFILTDIGTEINEYLPRFDLAQSPDDKEGGKWSILAWEKPLAGVPKMDVGAMWKLSFELRIASILWTSGTTDRLHHNIARTTMEQLTNRNPIIYFA